LLLLTFLSTLVGLRQNTHGAETLSVLPESPSARLQSENILRRFSNSDTLFGPKSIPDGKMGPNRNTNTTNRTAEADFKIKEMVEPKLEVFSSIVSLRNC